MLSCNQILPAEERYNLTFEPPRPPGPSGGRLAFNTLPMPTQPVAVKKEPQHYTLDYDFDGMVNFKTPVPARARARHGQGHAGVARGDHRLSFGARCCRTARCCRRSRTSPGGAPNRWSNC